MFRQTLWPFLQPVRQRLCSVFQNQTGSTDETETEWLLYITRLLITRLITDLLNSSSVKIYNPVFCSRLCPGSKSPLCCWRQWGVYSPTGWDGGVFVQGQWSEWLGEHSGYSQVQYAKWECERDYFSLFWRSRLNRWCVCVWIYRTCPSCCWTTPDHPPWFISIFAGGRKYRRMDWEMWQREGQNREMRLKEGLLHFVSQCPEKRNKRH